jgi:Ca2+-binding RTX toxin-like protein
VAGAQQGSVVLDTVAKTITFTPLAGFTGAAGFTYTLSDGQLSSTVNVSINVLPSVINGTTANDVLAGTAGSDELYGNAGNDTLSALAGNDTLDGGTGADSLTGGTGNDIYVVDDVGDVITENANEGTDTVSSAITYTLGTNVENLTLTGTAAINGTGNSLNNILTGNSANNSLNGGSGIDTLIGNAGNDIYTVDNSGDVVIENAGEGSDTVNSTITYTLGSNVENLFLINNLAINASGNALNNTIKGGSGNNTLWGFAGDDSLNGQGGVDVMIGGTGNDTYVVDNAGDVVTENANEGTDTVSSTITYVLGSNLENLTLGGSSAINGTGNTLDNSLIGNSGINVLIGNAGNDNLNGGAGADTLIGGIGNDSYTVDVIDDVVTENANEGTDLINSAIAYTLGANVENLTLTGSAALNGSGNALNNVLIGNSGANTLIGLAGDDVLDGSTGADRMEGGIGNDTYFIENASDIVVENPGEGIDTVNSSRTYTLGTDVENLTLTGTSAINGTGNSVANVLTGNSAANTLTGAAGNDTYVFGRGGAADTIVDTDSTSGNTDLLSFTSGIATDQLWFRHVGNNLEVSIIGTSDKATISNWYSGSANHVEQFKTADGKLLLDSQVDNLVNAMAAFAPPSAGQTTLPQNYQNSLNSVIAANWH